MGSPKHCPPKNTICKKLIYLKKKIVHCGQSMGLHVGPCSHWCYTGSEKLRPPFNISLHVKLNSKGQSTTCNKTSGRDLSYAANSTAWHCSDTGRVAQRCLYQLLFKNSRPIWAMFAHSVQISGFIFSCTPAHEEF